MKHLCILTLMVRIACVAGNNTKLVLTVALTTSLTGFLFLMLVIAVMKILQRREEKVCQVKRVSHPHLQSSSLSTESAFEMKPGFNHISSENPEMQIPLDSERKTATMYHSNFSLYEGINDIEPYQIRGTPILSQIYHVNNGTPISPTSEIIPTETPNGEKNIGISSYSGLYPAFPI